MAPGRWPTAIVPPPSRHALLRIFYGLHSFVPA